MSAKASCARRRWVIGPFAHRVEVLLRGGGVLLLAYIAELCRARNARRGSSGRFSQRGVEALFCASSALRARSSAIARYPRAALTRRSASPATARLASSRSWCGLRGKDVLVFVIATGAQAGLPIAIAPCRSRLAHAEGLLNDLRRLLALAPKVERLHDALHPEALDRPNQHLAGGVIGRRDVRRVVRVGEGAISCRPRPATCFA